MIAPCFKGTFDVGTHYDGAPEEELALDAFIKLMRAAQSVEAKVNGHLDQWGLTSTQFGVMEAVYHLGPMHQTQLGDKLLKSGGNITVVVNNLEERGLVRRERMESDRRYVSIHLTDEGRELIEDVMPQHVDTIVERFSALDADDQRTLAQLCRRLGLTQEPEADETICESSGIASDS